MSRARPSPEALKILAETAEIDVNRSPENLPNLRVQTKAFIKPAVERAKDKTGVSIQTVKISGVECLEVLPKRPSKDWTLLYFFGGGFVQGSAFEDLTIAAPLCALTGAKIILPKYRLAPEDPWPAAVEDGFAVYKALANEPFGIVGESAGGNLALSSMLRANQEEVYLPFASVLLSPWCDLTNSSDSQKFNDGRDPT